MTNRIIDKSIVTVGQALLPLEDTTNKTAAEAHRAVATMLDERRKAHRAGLDADFGSDAIAMASKGADHLTLAANCFGTSHSQLFGILEDLGYGPQCIMRGLVAANAA